MKNRGVGWTFLTGVWAGLAAAVPVAHALILYPSADPAFNTTPPTGPLVGSGWQYAGFFNNFTGFPISEDSFLVSKHVVGGLHLNGFGGGLFTYQGITYSTVGRYDEPGGADLTVLKINPLAPAGPFPSWAPLYRRNDEAGKNFVVLGRGVIRGAPVDIAPTATTALSPNGTFRGWRWAADAGPLRWGENTVDFIVSDPLGGQFLFSSLTSPSAGGLANEASLAINDSSGAVFIQDPVDGIWKLAGMNLGVDASFSLTPGGLAVNMGLIDAGGLYDGVNQLQDTTDYDLVFGNDYQVYTGANDPVSHLVGNFHPRIANPLVLEWLDAVTVPEGSTGAGFGMAGAALGWLVLGSRGRRGGNSRQ